MPAMIGKGHHEVNQGHPPPGRARDHAGMAKPNILLITTDQQRWDALSLLGTPGYRTPNLDRLAGEGMAFARCYTPSPVCTPARVSLITGQYPTRHGAYSIGMRPVEALDGPVLPRLLGAAGYDTAVIGKTHFVARNLESRHVAGWDVDRPEEPDDADWDAFDGSYLGFDFVRHCSGHSNDRRPGAHYRRWLRARGQDLDHCHRIPLGPGRHNAPEPLDLSEAEAHNARQASDGPWDIPAGLTQNAWIAEETVGWLDRRRDRPWFCMANFQDPHGPLVCPEPYYSAVDMAGVGLGEPHPTHLADRPPFYQHFVEGRRWYHPDAWHDGDEAVSYSDGLLMPATAGYGNTRNPAGAIRAYIGMVAMVDHYVGMILDALAARGEAENTLVLFTSDHGELLGRHGMWGKGLPAFDDSQRVPCLMRWPAAQPRALGPGRGICNLVDLMPTALEAAGIEPPPLTQGVSQLPILRGEVDTVRDWALVDNLSTYNQKPERRHRDMHQQTLVAEEWKIVCYRHADYGELYDLTVDPDQRRNCWDDPETREAKQRMLLRLAQANMSVAGTMPERVWMA
jgi:arylsulfatase A-like enzyme